MKITRPRFFKTLLGVLGGSFAASALPMKPQHASLDYLRQATSYQDLQERLVDYFAATSDGRFVPLIYQMNKDYLKPQKRQISIIVVAPKISTNWNEPSIASPLGYWCSDPQTVKAAYCKIPRDSPDNNKTVRQIIKLLEERGLFTEINAG